MRVTQVRLTAYGTGAAWPPPPLPRCCPEAWWARPWRLRRSRRFLRRRPEPRRPRRPPPTTTAAPTTTPPPVDHDAGRAHDQHVGVDVGDADQDRVGHRRRRPSRPRPRPARPRRPRPSRPRPRPTPKPPVHTSAVPTRTRTHVPTSTRTGGSQHAARAATRGRPRCRRVPRAHAPPALPTSAVRLRDRAAQRRRRAVPSDSVTAVPPQGDRSRRRPAVATSHNIDGTLELIAILALVALLAGLVGLYMTRNRALPARRAGAPAGAAAAGRPADDRRSTRRRRADADHDWRQPDARPAAASAAARPVRGAAPERGDAVSEPAADPDCLFCRIVAHEVPSTVVAETAHSLAFRDISPAAPTHVLVIPKAHYPTAAALAAADPVGLRRPDGHRRRGRGRSRGWPSVATGWCSTPGRDAGQTVFHAHAHVLGGRDLRWPPG